jgi:hypothetical protein
MPSTFELWTEGLGVASGDPVRATVHLLLMKHTVSLSWSRV